MARTQPLASIAFLLLESDKKAFQALANREGEPMAFIVRQLVKEYIRTEGRVLIERCSFEPHTSYPTSSHS